MRNRKSSGKRSKGMAIVLTTLSLALILPLVGLGFDVGTLYLVQSKLGSAADAAALAGARALADGANAAAQASNAVSSARSFFSANFPAGYWNTKNASVTATVDDTSTPNYRTVRVSATAQAPLYFLRIFNQETSTINVSSTAGRRDVELMLVLDRSSSMTGTVPGTGQTACQIMKADAADFVNYFAPGRDQLGLVVFGSSEYTYQSTTAFTTPDSHGNTLPSLIGQISCGGNTNSAYAISQAYAEIQRVNNPNRMNVIVFMTDGRPNGVTANYYPLVTDHCTSTQPFIGVLAQWAGGAVPSGSTAGLMNYSTTSITNANEGAIPGSTNCQFYKKDLTYVTSDISNLPAQDINGNSTTGPYSQENPAWPYNGHSTTLTNGASSPQQIVLASTNLLDNEATVIRSNATLHPSIYTIALMGDGGVNDQPDPLLLRKIANDPTLAADPGLGSTFFQQQINQPHGYFAIAPDASQLAMAFDTIATQISIRLAQ